MKTPNITTTVELKTLPPPWRLRLVYVLQLIGILAGFIGGADFLQLIALLPPDTSAWLLVAGPAFASGAKPLITLVGDVLDDGVKNDSFKLTPLLVIGMCVLCLPSCTVSLTPDGKPQIGVDPVALAQAIDAYQRKNDSKNATVVVLDSNGNVVPVPSQPTEQ